MSISRRQFLQTFLGVSAAGLSLVSELALATLSRSQQLRQIFALNSFDETITELFDGEKLIDNHNKIKFIRLPQVAENGAIVPIKINSTLKNVTNIYILVKKNPHPLSAEFELSPALVAEISCRIKMAKSSEVIIIVKADGQYFRKKQYVKVAKGGCGG